MQDIAELNNTIVSPIPTYEQYENIIFPLTKYKNMTYKQVFNTNDDKYFKYLIGSFKFNYNEIYDFYQYLLLKNKFTTEISKLLNIKILLDTETTGFANYDSVLQLSYIVFNENEIIKTFNQIVQINPKIKISNSDIHGITNQRCAKDGICITSVLDTFVKDLTYCKAIIGHNISFDIRMLTNEFNRAKYDCTPMSCKKIEDTMSIHGKRIKLGVLYEQLFNQPMLNAHDAYYDVIATYRIYKELIKNSNK